MKKLTTTTRHLGRSIPLLLFFNGIIISSYAQVPANDACINAITLPVTSSCSKVWGTVVNSTASGTASACGGATGYDVWYKFTATTANATIQTNDFGANYTNRRLQVFSGTCGGLTVMSCISTGTPMTTSALAVTAGTTYYIRVFSTTITAPTTAGDFSICVTTSATLPPRYGNSYVNVSKKTAGGVVEKGDTLEIRMTVNHTSGTIYRARYVDNVPSNTAMLTGPTDSLRIITNEGLTFRKYTINDGVYDDAGTFLSSPPVGEFNVRMNLGLGASPPGTPLNNTATNLTGADGQLVAAGAANKPRGGGGMLFATSFRVVVTGDPGDTINFGTGRFIYRTVSSGGSDITLNTIPFRIRISEPLSLCANATGVNSAEEFGGTFGSGTTPNRPTNLTYPIPGYTFVNSSATQGVGDGQYSIVKNISPRSGTIRTAERTPTCPTPLPSELSCTFRMHGGHWDIDGDHTGTNNSIGNLPPAAATAGGYMLMVNADYVASETYRQTINNLCPETYYEFSAWIRNICPTCGIDSTGASYLPRRPGVLPNLTFSLDDIDRYSTGEVDTVGWIKKGFVFRTEPGQTSMTFSIRNNSQGGGGNDWVIDDISVATCLPNMTYTPTLNPTVCEGNSLTINNLIGSYFDNYTHHVWQRSTDNGVTWTNLGIARDSVPVYNSFTNSWEYSTSYTVPPSLTTEADSGDLYRVLVATSSANLGSTDCQVTDGISLITMNVLDCTPVLSTNLYGFTGKLIDSRSILHWTTSKEESALSFQIQRSDDGRNFFHIGSVAGYNDGNSINKYQFSDPTIVTEKAWYRVILTTSDNKQKITPVIQLQKEMAEFSFGNVINPFSNNLRFDISVSRNSLLTIELIDGNGKMIRKEKQLAYSGANAMSLPDTRSIPAGIYSLRVTYNDIILTRRVMKIN